MKALLTRSLIFCSLLLGVTVPATAQTNKNVLEYKVDSIRYKRKFSNSWSNWRSATGVIAILKETEEVKFFGIWEKDVTFQIVSTQDYSDSASICIFFTLIDPNADKEYLMYRNKLGEIAFLFETDKIYYLLVVHSVE